MQYLLLFYETVANSGISFESAFTGVTKTVDATSEELSKLRKGIRGMAKEMPESVEEISGVAEAAGQLGIKTKSVAGFTKTMVILVAISTISFSVVAILFPSATTVDPNLSKFFWLIPVTLANLK